MNTALPNFLNPDKSHYIFDDFINDDSGLLLTGPANLSASVAASGICAVETTPIADSFGALSVSTGTSSNVTSKAVYQSSQSVNKIKTGITELTIEWRVRFPILSDTTGLLQYIGRAGIQDSSVLGDPTNGIYFYYKAATSLKWYAYTRGSSISSSFDTGITVVANTWYKLKIIINAAGTNVAFFINDVLVGNLTTNITTTNAMRLMASIERINSGSSTNQARLMYIDWVYFKSLR